MVPEEQPDANIEEEIDMSYDNNEQSLAPHQPDEAPEGAAVIQTKEEQDSDDESLG